MILMLYCIAVPQPLLSEKLQPSRLIITASSDGTIRIFGTFVRPEDDVPFAL